MRMFWKALLSSPCSNFWLTLIDLPVPVSPVTKILQPVGSVERAEEPALGQTGFKFEFKVPNSKQSVAGRMVAKMNRYGKKKRSKRICD